MALSPWYKTVRAMQVGNRMAVFDESLASVLIQPQYHGVSAQASASRTYDNAKGGVLHGCGVRWVQERAGGEILGFDRAQPQGLSIEIAADILGAVEGRARQRPAKTVLAIVGWAATRQALEPGSIAEQIARQAAVRQQEQIKRLKMVHRVRY
jgi:hypothetical protein